MAASPLLAGIRAVVFDAVGTVIVPDPGAAAVYRRVAERRGVPVPDDWEARLWAQFRVEEAADRAAGWRTSESRESDRWRAVVAAAIPGSTDELFEELFRHFAEPQAWRVPAEAAVTIAALHRRGFLLGMGSNYDRRLRAVVAGTPPLAPLAGRLVVSSEVGWRKPAKEFFAAVVEAAGCPPGELLFVGDDEENDVQGAEACGLRALLIDGPAAWVGLYHP